MIGSREENVMPPTISTDISGDGRDEWWAALEAALKAQGYGDLKEINVLQLRRRFGIEHLIDREGMRLALLRKRAPRNLKQRQEILDAIRETNIRPLGMQTAETLFHLLSDASPYFNISRDEADLRLDSRLDASKVLIRCVDEPGEAFSETDKLREHINAATQLLGQVGAVTSIHLLTWNGPGAEALSGDADRRGISLESVPQFLKTCLDFKNAKEVFEDRLKQNLDPQAASAQPDTALSDAEWLLQDFLIDGQHSKEELVQILAGTKPTAASGTINVVIAKTGAGKSSLVLRTSLDILADWDLKDQTVGRPFTKIPVIVRGRDLGIERSFDSLALAVSQNIGLQYNLSLPVATAKTLMERGYLHVMIDSIEETPNFSTLEDLYAFIGHLQNPKPLDSDFLITCRVEVFPLEEQRHDHALMPSGRLHWISLDQIDPDSLSTKSESLLRFPGEASLNKSLIEPALLPLQSRPLFFRFLSEDSSRDLISRLGATTRGKVHGTEQNAKFYELFDKLARRWAHQVTDGFPAGTFDISVDSFLQLCRLLVGIFFELSLQRGETLRNNIRYPQSIILEKFLETEWQPAPGQQPLSGPELLRFLNYSTIFCQGGDGEGAIGELRMPSTSLLAYFLSEYLVEPFFGTAHEALKNTRLLIERLSATSLERLTIPYDASEHSAMAEPGAIHEPFSRCARAVLLMFVSGSLTVKKLPNRLSALLSDLSGSIPSNSTEQQETIQSLALSALKAPLWFSENLLLLINRSTPMLKEEGHGKPIDIAGLSCPLSKFEELLGSGSTLIASGSANLEFATLPAAFTEQPPHPPYLHRTLVEDLVKNEKAQRALEAALASWKRHRELLGECRIVLGGKHYVGRYNHYAVRDLLHQGRYPAPNCSRIQLPTFLIQNQPVSNKNFLRFLRSKPGKRWNPITVRDETRNDYYLRAWDEVIDNFGWDYLVNAPMAVLGTRKTSNGLDLAEWLEAPVVYVNWQASSEYAKWLHCRLPTEAEYEAAARAYQHNLLHDFAKLNHAERPSNTAATTFFSTDLPWAYASSLITDSAGPLAGRTFTSTDALTEFALRLGEPGVDGGGPEVSRDMFPYIRKLLTPPLRFKEWEDSVESILFSSGLSQELAEALRPVQHLVGGLRYWMEDVWNPCWPPNNRPMFDDVGEYLQAPYQDGWSRTWNDIELTSGHITHSINNWRKDKQRVLRGSSIQMSDSQMRISYRESQREVNVNPDVGFRCVQVIWCDRSIEYPGI